MNKNKRTLQSQKGKVKKVVGYLYNRELRVSQFSKKYQRNTAVKILICSLHST